MSPNNQRVQKTFSAPPMMISNRVKVEVAASPTQKRIHHEDFPLCNSNIFTDHGTGSILHVVQMSRIFPDSKTFVDMKVLRSPNLVQLDFDSLMDQHDGDPPASAVRDFVEDNFTLENQMEEHKPADWTPAPKLLSKIADPVYRKFAHDLNARWDTLCRKIKDEVRDEQEKYTLIYLPNPVVVPGGRFREIYYWDSFWIIRGLLLCDMRDTVRGMLENFVEMVRLYGKIPNGGRTYYLNRSQPPLFIQMVEEYVKVTKDVEFVRENMQYLVKEFNYWLQEHLVSVTKDGKQYNLARYNCEDAGPRPESYYEDYEVAAQHTDNVEDKARMYWEMKTGAETGWDYSSRWMITEDGSVGSLHDTKARYILPVDLNAFLAKNAAILSKYAREVFQDEASAKTYGAVADDLVDAMDAVLWSEEDGVWYDYDFLNHRPRRTFTPSNLVPLWTESFRPANRQRQSREAVAYLRRQELGLYPGGVPTTFETTGEQWDFPNCWPPLEHMIVQGLERTGLPEARELAFEIAEKRVRGSYTNFMAKEHMFEKYDASSIQKIGGGGEYEIQIGFGWTNGVVLDFLNTYSSKLSIASEHASAQVNANEEYVIREP